MIIEYIPINQLAPGTTLIKAAPSGENRVKILGFYLAFSAAGTFKFVDGTGDLMGEISVVKDAPPYSSEKSGEFFLEGHMASALSLTTTLAKATGFVTITVEPARDFGKEWIRVHRYIEEHEAILEAIMNTQDVDCIHTYVSGGPSDWRYNIGVRSQINMLNGSVFYVTETLDQLQRSMQAKVVY